MNCNIYQTEIEELTGAKALSAESARHLEKCPTCRAFKIERERLLQMLGSLGQVKAPNDFNFRVKARLRKMQPSAKILSPAKMVWLTSSAALICLSLMLTFVLTTNRETSQIIHQPETNSIAAGSQTTALADNDQPPQSSAAPLSTKEVIQPSQPPPNSVAMQIGTKTMSRQSVMIKPAPFRKIAVKKDKEIFSADAGLDTSKPPIMASGFNDPLATPKKQTAAGLLRTVGIETESNAEGLSVIKINSDGQAARSDLRTGDIIQKVNGENPLAISGNEFKEFKLTVRRQNQTQEIIITAKPQN